MSHKDGPEMDVYDPLRRTGNGCVLEAHSETRGQKFL